MSLLSFSSVYLFETIVHSEKFDAKFNGAANTLGKHIWNKLSPSHAEPRLFLGDEWQTL